MADDRYGGPRRRNSIFSDDHRGAPPSGGRGFFERAGEELRSWFGDDEPGHDGGSGDWNRQSNRSSYGGREGGHGGGEHYRPADRHGSDVDSSRSGGQSRPERPQSGTSHFDENYRRWRDAQIAQMDREYEDYCRERQQHFENDFHSWRSSRQMASGAGQAQSGPPHTDEGNRSVRPEPAGATTTGTGEGSATQPSTGSSPTFPKE